MTDNYDRPDHRDGNSIERTLGRIEGTLNGVAKDIADNHERMNLHSERIGSLEKSRARVYGAGSVLAVGFTAIIGWVSHRFNIL